MIIGYNTNGMAHHDLIESIGLLADLGYRSVAITLDHGALNPFDDRHEKQLRQVHRLLKQRGMRSVIETGARYLLDPRYKHEPTLLTADPQQRERRTDFLCKAIDIATALESDCVSFWSGILRDDCSYEEAMVRLVETVSPVVEHAANCGVAIGFEPEPDMFIDTVDSWDQLAGVIDAPNFQLTLDVGHLHCQGEAPPEEVICEFADQIVNVHIEDMIAGVHEHLMFGEGEIDFPPVIDALAEVGYQGALHVELSRHSHVGPAAATYAIQFLRALIEK